MAECRLRYGSRQAFEVSLARGSQARGPAADADFRGAEVAAAVAKSLREPIDFPPLEQCVVPDDRVVLAVDPNIPAPREVIHGLLQALPLSQLNAVQVLLGEEASGGLVQQLREVLPTTVEVIVHQPDHQDELGYLAATEHADPIYLHRTLLDAGLVVPVMVVRPETVLDVGVAGGGVYPWLADRRSQLRVAHGLTGGDAARDAALREAEAVAWQLGLQLELQILPSADGGVGAVASGTMAGLRRHWRDRLTALWAETEGPRPDLVVACLPGDPQQQSWENVARAAFAAAQIVRPGGTIAVCSDLTEDPPPAVSQIGAIESGSRMAARLENDRSRYALTANALWQTSTQGRLLLLSQLHRETVEDLGFGVLESPAEIQRLIDQHRRCVIINAAQYGGVSRAEVA